MSIPAPDLRIVPEPLWLAVRTRLDEARAVYVERTRGTTFGRPKNGGESKYLLTGFGQCGICGSSLIVRTCSGYHLRGTSVCSNRSDMPMAAADAAVLDTLATDILNPAVLDAALARASERVEGRRRQPDQRKQTAAELSTRTGTRAVCGCGPCGCRRSIARASAQGG